MRNRKTKLIVAAVLLIALAAPAATFAYFTDYEDGYGGAVLKLEGETTIQEDADSDQKVISIKNVGETDVIVRLAVHGDYVKHPYTYERSSDWTVDGDEDGGWIYYNGILAPGGETSTITVLVDKTAAEAAGHDFDIVVVHESQRVSYEQVVDSGKTYNKVVLPEGWTNPNISVVMSEEVGD